MKPPHHWSGRRGGSWFTAGDVTPALSREYSSAGTANWLGFRTYINHRMPTQ